MSLIKKIVDIVDKNEGVDARKNIIKLKKEVTSYKDKIKHYIDRNYVEFLPDIVNNEMYLEEGINLQDKIQDLSENAINEGKSIVYSAHDEMSKHIDELNEIQMGLEIALKLMKIDAFLQQINMFNESESYTEVNDILTSIDLILKDPANQIIRKMDMYPNLKIRLDNEYQNMLLNLKRNLDKHIQLNEKTFPTNKSITISLSKNKEALKQTVETLSDANFSFQKISDFLLGNVFEPTFAKPVSLDFVDTEKDYVVLSMSFSTKPTPENLKPTYGTVFSNLKRLIHFLKDMNVLINGQVHFLPLIFGKCEKNFVELLINQCIVYAIPNTIEERKNSTLKDDILKLHKSFVDNKFLESSDSDKLRDFVQQIDDLFQNRFSKNVLDQSALIVKKDLHDMILAPEGVISTGAAAFPRCMISKSTLEIINLLGKVLNQAKNATDNSMADSLYEAVETTLKNYPFTIQQYHSKFLSKIPQQSAVFYNNCMYLAHWLSFSDQIVVKGIEAVTTSLTKQGTDIFEHQVEKQKILLLDVLKEFDLSETLTNLSPEYYKPVRQSLRQMDLLKNVWQTILPNDLYNRTMGNLLDVLCKDLCKKICSLEDISSTLCSGLVDLIKIIIEKGPNLFEDESSVFNYVSHWQKLINLQFVLDTTLVNITEMWKTGKLSQTFKADEMKHLIRALFQNTDRRANALSTIV